MAAEGYWMAKAFPKKTKGALHRQLGIAQGKKIPRARLLAAARKGGKMGRRARLAITASKFKH